MTRPRRERGAIEVLPLAVLVAVCGTLLLTDLWGIIDAKTTVDLAAREGVRTYVDTPSSTSAEARAAARARSAIAAAGRNPAHADITGSLRGFDRCAVAELRVSYRLRLIRMPWIGAAGPTVEVRGHHREVVNRFGSKESGDASCT